MLREIGQQYRQALDLMHEFAYSFKVEADGTLICEWITMGFERMTGYTQAEVGGRWVELFHTEDRANALAALQQVLQGQQTTATQRIVSKNGGVRWVRTINYPVRDHRDSVVGFYGAGRDVTEEQIVQAQQARFITNAMHELSHPVSSILLRLYLMRKQPERLNEHLDALQPVAEQIKRMIEDMREVSYLEQGIIFLQKQIFDLQPVLTEIVRAHQPTAEARSIDIVYAESAEPLRVMADPGRIRQALTNLLVNSINLTVEGGTVEIRAYAEHATHAVVYLRHHRLLIERDHPTLVFRPFHRASEGRATHTGLELTITREIMRLHGGEASVMVDDNERSVFHLWLPLAME